MRASRVGERSEDATESALSGPTTHRVRRHTATGGTGTGAGDIAAVLEDRRVDYVGSHDEP